MTPEQRNDTPRRSGPNRARWRELVVMTVIATSLVLLASYVVASPLAAAIAWVDTRPVALASVAVLLVFGAWWARERAWPRRLGFRHVLRYPPGWLGGVAGACAVLTAAPWWAGEALGGGLDVGLLHALGWTLFVAVLLVVPSVAGVDHLAAPLRRRSQTTSAGAGLNSAMIETLPPADPKTDLFEWARTDGPVADRADDRFGHAHVADRMLARLRPDDGRKPPSQVLIGELGAGKSSVKQLIAAQLAESPQSGVRILLVTVELWRYETVRAAVEGTIQSIVDAISTEVETTSLRGMPEAYVRAMSEGGSILSALAALGGTPPDPMESLRALERIQSAINVHVVLWVEDLERFAAGESPSEWSHEKLNPLQALLHGLDQQQTLSVIVATTTLEMRIDVDKIARHVELLRPLGLDQSLAIVHELHERCLHDEAFIDLVPQKDRERSFPSGDRSLTLLRRALGPANRSVADGIAALFRTPRLLQRYVRDVGEDWNHLRGEVELDDLMVLVALKIAAPEVLATLPSIAALLRTNERRWVPADPAERSKVEQALDVVRSRSPHGDTARFLVEKLIEHRASRRQALLSHGPTNYLERVLSAAPVERACGDQRVLSVLRSGDVDDLVELLEDARTRPLAEYFRDELPGGMIERALFPMVRRRAGLPPNEADFDEPLIAVWRTWLHLAERQRLEVRLAVSELAQSFEVAVPSSLWLSHELWYFFLHEKARAWLDPEPRGANPNDARAQLLGTLFGALRELGADPQRLAYALHVRNPFTLADVLLGLGEGDRSTPVAVPFEGWQGFAEALLIAAEEAPTAVLPQLAGLVCARQPHEQRYWYERSRAEALFGEHTERLEALLRSEVQVADDTGGRVLAGVRETLPTQPAPSAAQNEPARAIGPLVEETVPVEARVELGPRVPRARASGKPALRTKRKQRGATSTSPFRRRLGELLKPKGINLTSALLRRQSDPIVWEVKLQDREGISRQLTFDVNADPYSDPESLAHKILARLGVG